MSAKVYGIASKVTKKRSYFYVQNALKTVCLKQTTLTLGTYIHSLKAIIIDILQSTFSSPTYLHNENEIAIPSYLDRNIQRMTSLWRRSRPTYHNFPIFLWSPSPALGHHMCNLCMKGSWKFDHDTRFSFLTMYGIWEGRSLRKISHKEALVWED